MTTFDANTLSETAGSKDGRRFAMTFEDADGGRCTISIPAGMAGDIAHILQSVASDVRLLNSAELTRVPKACAVGQAASERMVLLRFDEEPPYAINLAAAEELGRELQEQSEQLACLARPALN
jgi:hypothetical protein